MRRSSKSKTLWQTSRACRWHAPPPVSAVQWKMCKRFNKIRQISPNLRLVASCKISKMKKAKMERWSWTRMITWICWSIANRVMGTLSVRSTLPLPSLSLRNKSSPSNRQTLPKQPKLPNPSIRRNPASSSIFSGLKNPMPPTRKVLWQDLAAFRAKMPMERSWTSARNSKKRKQRKVRDPRSSQIDRYASKRRNEWKIKL